MPYVQPAPRNDQSSSYQLCIRNTILTHDWSALGSPDQVLSSDDSPVEWCSSRSSNNCSLRDVRTVVMLALRELWKHRNVVVSAGASLAVQQAINNIAQEARSWSSAGMFKGDLTFFFAAIYNWANGEQSM